jgi:hypothetical protein
LEEAGVKVGVEMVAQEMVEVGRVEEGRGGRARRRRGAWGRWRGVHLDGTITTSTRPKCDTVS